MQRQPAADWSCPDPAVDIAAPPPLPPRHAGRCRRTTPARCQQQGALPPVRPASQRQWSRRSCRPLCGLISTIPLAWLSRPTTAAQREPGAQPGVLHGRCGATYRLALRLPAAACRGSDSSRLPHPAGSCPVMMRCKPASRLVRLHALPLRRRRPARPCAPASPPAPSHSCRFCAASVTPLCRRCAGLSQKWVSSSLQDPELLLQTGSYHILPGPGRTLAELQVGRGSAPECVCVCEREREICLFAGPVSEKAGCCCSQGEPQAPRRPCAASRSRLRLEATT